MSGTFITNTTRDGETFDGYLSLPSGEGTAPGILLISAIFGVDEEMEMLSDAWASDGFVVSTPDIFWRQAPGPTADLEAALDRMVRFDPEQGLRDIEDLLQALRAHPRCNGKVAVLGFCFGGGYAYLAAARLGADAAGAFHGTGIDQYLDEVDKIAVPVSFHFGDQDPIVPMDTVGAIRGAFAARPDAQIVVHEGATHNFSMPHKEGYNAAVASVSRKAVLECFRSMEKVSAPGG